MDCTIPDGPNIQHLLEVGPHVIVHTGVFANSTLCRVSGSVNSIWCLMRDVFPRSKLLWANRCSHLTSGFLVCSCSSLGHSSRPWGLSSFRSPIFLRPIVWASLRCPLSEPPVAPGWLEWPYHLPPWWGLQWGRTPSFLKQFGTQEELGCNSPYMAVSTMEVGNWEPCAGSDQHMDPHTVPSDVCLAMNVYGPKQRDQVTLHVVQTCA